MKKLFVLLASIATFSTAHAEPLKSVYNAFTGKPDWITRIDSHTIIPGTNVTVTSNSGGTVTIDSTGGGGGGGVPTLGVSKSGVLVSSPTSTLDFNGEGVAVSLGGSTTAQVTIVSTTAYTTKNQTWTSPQTWTSSGTFTGNALVSGTLTGTNITATSNVTVSSTILLSPSSDGTTSGSSATVTSHASPYVRLTNPGLSSIARIGTSGVAGGHVIIFDNSTGHSITVVNNVDSSGQQVITGTNSNLYIPNNGTFFVIYDANANHWNTINGASSGLLFSSNTWTAPNTFSSSSTFSTIESTVLLANQFVKSDANSGLASASAVDVSSEVIGQLPQANMVSTVAFTTKINTFTVPQTFTSSVTFSTSTAFTINVSSKVVWADGSISTTSAMANGNASYIQNRSTLQAGATAFPDFVIAGSSVSTPVLTFSSNTLNTCPGCYAEYVSTVAASASSFAATQTFQNYLSFILQPGDWVLSGGLNFNTVASTSTVNFQIAISSYSANTTTDMVWGLNNFVFNSGTANFTTGRVIYLNVPSYRVLVTTPTTYYLKGYADFPGSTGTPNIRVGSMNAQRRR